MNEIIDMKMIKASRKYVFNENCRDSIPISVNVNSNLLLDTPIKTYEEARQFIDANLGEVRLLAENAFRNKIKPSWDEIQNLLYYWNINTLMKKNIADYRNHIFETLRNEVANIEAMSRESYILACESNFTPSQAVSELAERANSHRINNHPLLLALHEDGLSLDAVRILIDNYYVNNRAFHLFVAALSLSTPIEYRPELAVNFYDEMGEGDFAMAHPILFFKNYHSLGVPTVIEPLPEALCLLNSKLYATLLSGDYCFGMGGFGFIELTMPNQMIKIFEGLKKSDLKDADLEFWETHIAVDLKHGEAWFEEMEKFLDSPTIAHQCLQGGMYLLEARATMYDGIWHAINDLK